MNLLRQIFLEDLGLKAISLLLAFLLWFQIAGQQTVQRSMVVPVEFTNMPADLEVANDYPRQVEVLVNMRAGVRMDERELAAVINMGNKGAGTEIVPLTADNIRNVPFGADIEKIEPARIRLQLERTRRKLVQVSPDITGQPAEGYELRELRLNPSEVLVSGPEPRLEGVTSAQTEPINLSGRSRSFTERVFLDLEDPGLRIENVDSVTAFVTIEEARREEILSSVPVQVEPSSQEAQIEPRTVEVIGTVPRSFEGDIDPQGFRAVVRVTEEMRGLQQAAPVVVVPSRYADIFRVTSIEPTTVRIRIR